MATEPLEMKASWGGSAPFTEIRNKKPPYSVISALDDQRFSLDRLIEEVQMELAEFGEDHHEIFEEWINYCILLRTPAGNLWTERLRDAEPRIYDIEFGPRSEPAATVS